MKEILQFLGGEGVEKLEKIDKDFNDQLDATKELIGREYEILKNLYQDHEFCKDAGGNSIPTGLKFNKDVFDKAQQTFSKTIETCFNELKIDLSSAITEKKLFIEQVKEQYVGALKGALGQKDNNDFAFLYQQYDNSSDKNSLDNKIYNKLPKWIQQGVDGFTTKLTIGDKEVGFIFNQSQKNIIEKLKEFANPYNKARSQTQSFYLGTGGGKTYLNDLISGKQNLKIKGSDDKEYKAEDIKKAIFGDSEPHIISINFHQIKNQENFIKLLSGFNDTSKKKILILDEYHLFPKEVRVNLKATLENQDIFVIKSTATPTPEELYYKNLKREILGVDGTKKLNKSTYDEIQGKIDLFLNYSEAPNQGSNRSENVANNNKKYHLIIDSAMNSDALLSNKKIENCKINASIKDAKPDIKIFGFKNEENQEQFFIEEKQSDGVYKKVAADTANSKVIFSKKYFDKKELTGYLSEEKNREKKYQIYYPDSISAGGDLNIKGGSGETKISIVINEELLTKPATEIVNYVLQAVGRDRSFDFSEPKSFANVKFIDKGGNDNQAIIVAKFKEAKEFYNEKKGDAKPLFDYLQNKFKSSEDKNYIALFYKIINDNQSKNIANLIESFKKSFDNQEDFKKFESRFVAASIIKQFKDCDHVFAKDIKETAKKITNSGDALQNQKIIDSFKGKLEEKGVFFEDGVSFTADIFFEDLEKEIVVNYKIKATNSGGAIFSTNNAEQKEKVESLLTNCNIEVGEKTEFLYNQTLESLEVEGANEIKTLVYNTNFKSLECNGNVFKIVDSVSKINHKEGDKAISLEVKAIAHLFEKVLESKDNKFTKENKKLIEEFFKNNPVKNDQVKVKNPIFSPLSNSNSEGKSDNSSTGFSDEKNNLQTIPGKQQVNQALTAEQKLEIIKTALSQRNKYNAEGSKNIDDRAGNDYKSLKTTLQALNENSINFTTESLKLFNDDGKTLGTRKEVDNLIEKKPLFVRAMKEASIINFKKIDIPQSNIILKDPKNKISSQILRVKLTKLQESLKSKQQ